MDQDYDWNCLRIARLVTVKHMFALFAKWGCVCQAADRSHLVMWTWIHFLNWGNVIVLCEDASSASIRSWLAAWQDRYQRDISFQRSFRLCLCSICMLAPLNHLEQKLNIKAAQRLLPIIHCCALLLSSSIQVPSFFRWPALTIIVPSLLLAIQIFDAYYRIPGRISNPCLLLSLAACVS